MLQEHALDGDCVVGADEVVAALAIK